MAEELSETPTPTHHRQVADDVCRKDGPAHIRLHTGTAKNALALPCEEMIRASGVLEADKLGSIHVLDMGCGRKPWVTLQLLGSSSSTSRTRQDLQIVAIDATANNIQQATHYLNDTGEELDNVLTLVMDMQSLTGLLSGGYDYVLANFSLQMVHDPDAALDEAHRVLSPGGKLGLTVWQALSWMHLLADAVEQQLDPASISSASREIRHGKSIFPTNEECLLGLSNGQPWYDEEYVRQKLSRNQMFTDIRVTKVHATHVFTKHEFLQHFSTRVLDRILTTSGMSSDTAQQMRQALQRNFHDAQATDKSLLKLELHSLVVTARKQSSIPESC